MFVKASPRNGLWFMIFAYLMLWVNHTNGGISIKLYILIVCSIILFGANFSNFNGIFSLYIIVILLIGNFARFVLTCIFRICNIVKVTLIHS